ncbi:MAG: NAD(P)/FAD-dependent oxidoreductase [Lachnospiraceae bacterium]|nr:NAD(P)/FAD-dependent oxidoreductase [Lachnospiraceae bacterium]
MKIIVVGGGAAGMMAAIAAAQNGHSVTILEKNEKLGKKLFITGKGRCNFTNACSQDAFFTHVISNPKFLYSAFHRFDNQSAMEFFELHGLKYKIERGNRVFPRSDHSSDVIKTLQTYMSQLGVSVHLHTKAERLTTAEEQVTGVVTDRGTFTADAVILALGGKSYPSCGADGDTWRIMQKLGVDLTEAVPSLVPLCVEEEDILSLHGLTLKNVLVTVSVDHEVRYSEMGEMLFTHFGMSGPLILSASCYLSAADYEKKPKVSIDLKPALDEKKLDERILREFAKSPNKQFGNALSALLPSKLIPVVIRRSGIDKEKAVHDITKEERKRLSALLKNFTAIVTGNRGFGEAIITRGGVKTSEIDPKTMAVKKYKGLYVAGEMIDVDALTGGFNLQIAWSTGYLAGNGPGL